MLALYKLFLVGVGAQSEEGDDRASELINDFDRWLPCAFRISAKSNLTEISVISAERPFDRNFVPKGAGGWWWHSATGPRSTRCHPCPTALIEGN